MPTINVDNTPPEITYCGEDQSLQADDGQITVIAEWPTPTAVDNSGKVTVTCDQPSGSYFTIGQVKPVTCEAVDRSSNKAVCEFHVNVTGWYCLHYLYFRLCGVLSTRNILIHSTIFKNTLF